MSLLVNFNEFLDLPQRPACFFKLYKLDGDWESDIYLLLGYPIYNAHGNVFFLSQLPHSHITDNRNSSLMLHCNLVSYHLRVDCIQTLYFKVTQFLRAFSAFLRITDDRSERRVAPHQPIKLVHFNQPIRENQKYLSSTSTKISRKTSRNHEQIHSVCFYPNKLYFISHLIVQIHPFSYYLYFHFYLFSPFSINFFLNRSDWTHMRHMHAYCTRKRTFHSNLYACIDSMK